VLLEETIAKELAGIVNEQIAFIARRVDALEARAPAKGDKGDPGQKGDKGDRGEPGLAGANGERGDKGERGEKGDSGLLGEKGERGERGERGEKGEPGFVGRDGLPGLAGRDGKDGSPGKDGAPGKDGKDGVDGLGFEDMSLSLSEDGCSVIERYARGNVVKEISRRVRGRYCGPWKHGETYFFEDTVSWAGSGWVAIAQQPKGKPGECKDWQLFVKKGRDGRDGERGPIGPMGPAGKAASF
jgi:integrin beta 3